MIERMFERIPAWAISAVAMVLIVVLIYAAGWWWAGWPAPRWKCNDGYWHWRAECNGHESFLARARVATVAGEDRGGATEGSALRPHPDNAEAVLDEAWVDELHHINADLRQPPADLRGRDVLGIDQETWIDQWRIDHWDYDKWIDHVNEWRMLTLVAERKAFRLGAGLEWRDEMGLAA